MSTSNDELADRAASHLLASLLRDNAQIGRVLQMIHADHFRTDRDQKIFRGMTALFDRGRLVDAVALADELREEIADITYGYLGDLVRLELAGSNAAHYASLVRRYSIARSLNHVGREIAQLGEEAAGEGDDLLAEANRLLFDVSQRAVQGNIIGMPELMNSASDRIDRRVGGDDRSGIKTGCQALDVITGGFHPGEFTVIAARPSCGKTAYALGVASHAAVSLGVPVFLASLEQSSDEIGDRLISARARVDGHRLRRGNLGSLEIHDLVGAVAGLRGGKLFVDDSSAQSMLRIGTTARWLTMKHGVGLVIVDYLQLIEPEDRKAPRHEQVGAISRRLKGLARDLKIPVIALAQLNRGSEDRQGHRPRLSDLRESGSIEADADVVFLLHRPEVHNREERPGEVDLIVAKNRNGPIDEVSLKFHKATMVFEELVALPNMMGMG